MVNAATAIALSTPTPDTLQCQRTVSLSPGRLDAPRSDLMLNGRTPLSMLADSSQSTPATTALRIRGLLSQRRICAMGQPTTSSQTTSQQPSNSCRASSAPGQRPLPPLGIRAPLLLQPQPEKAQPSQPPVDERAVMEGLLKSYDELLEDAQAKLQSAIMDDEGQALSRLLRALALTIGEGSSSSQSLTDDPWAVRWVERFQRLEEASARCYQEQRDERDMKKCDRQKKAVVGTLKDLYALCESLVVPAPATTEFKDLDLNPTALIAEKLNIPDLADFRVRKGKYKFYEDLQAWDAPCTEVIEDAFKLVPKEERIVKLIYAIIQHRTPGKKKSSKMSFVREDSPTDRSDRDYRMALVFTLTLLLDPSATPTNATSASWIQVTKMKVGQGQVGRVTTIDTQLPHDPSQMEIGEISKLYDQFVQRQILANHRLAFDRETDRSNFVSLLSTSVHNLFRLGLHSTPNGTIPRDFLRTYLDQPLKADLMCIQTHLTSSDSLDAQLVDPRLCEKGPIADLLYQKEKGRIVRRDFKDFDMQQALLKYLGLNSYAPVALNKAEPLEKDLFWSTAVAIAKKRKTKNL